MLALKPNEFSENIPNGEVTSKVELWQWWLHGDPWLVLMCGAQRVDPGKYGRRMVEMQPNRLLYCMFFDV